MRKTKLIAVASLLAWSAAAAAVDYAATQGVGKPLEFAKNPDYSKRAQALDASIQAKLVGRWTNPLDNVIIEIESVDLASGRIQGKEWAQTGPAAGDAHELTGWVSAAPQKAGYDNVIPVSFSTTLYEYGTLPVWAGYLKGDGIVTMHYLVWPNQVYVWNHVSTFQETWTRLP